MKNLILRSLLLSTFVFAFAFTNAQKVLTEGYLKMEITDVASDDEQVAAMLQMMKGSQTEIHFKDGKNLSSMNMMGGMVQMKTLYDNKTEKMNMLMDMMGQKMNIESTKKEMEALNEEQAEQFEDFEVQYDDNDTKEILGYKCVKATIVDTKSKDAAFSMYVSKDVKADSKMLQGMQYFEIDGFPLELVVKQPQMTMTMTAVALEDKIDESVFQLDASGYTKMTFEEFMEKMGSMGGGMGF